jgi:hypothetical protein
MRSVHASAHEIFLAKKNWQREARYLRSWLKVFCQKSLAHGRVHLRLFAL